MSFLPVKSSLAECGSASNQALLAGVATTEPEPKIIQEVVDRVKASGKKGEEATDLGLDLLVSMNI